MKRKLLFLFFALCVSLANAQCWQDISASMNSYNIGIKNDGTLWAWGRNEIGQLGDGSTTNRAVPVQIGTASNWSKVETGYYNSIAIKTNGTLWTWGANEAGQLGNGTTTSSQVPIQVGSDTNWDSCTQGSSFTLAIKSNGTLWGWGRGSEGQLGNGSFTGSNVPIQIGTATNWLKVSAGLEQTIALKSDGTLWSFGKGNNGQLGLGVAVTLINSPQQIGTDNTWVDFSILYGHVVALRSNGTIWSWGKNFSGELGINSTTNTFNPTQIGFATNWTSVSAGVEHTMAIKSDGTLWAWGRNIYGNYGNGTTIQSNVPIQIGTQNNWTKVIAGFTYTLGINLSTGLNVWGYNLSNVVFGTGDSSSSNVPFPLGGCLLNDLDPPTASPIQIYAGTGLISNLIASGSSIKWYSYSSGGLALSNSTNLVDGTTYYASQTISGEESSNRVAVTVKRISEDNHFFCNSNPISNIIITPSNNALINWYTNEIGGSPLTNSTALSTGIYYVSQTVNSIESNRAAVSVTVNYSPNISYPALTSAYAINLPIANLIPTNTGGNVVSDGIVTSTYATGFGYPGGIALDVQGNLYVADPGNYEIKKIDANGISSSIDYSFNYPYDVATNSSGIVYVANTNSNEILKINTNGEVSFFASGFFNPHGLCLDASGNVYVADTYNGRIVKLDSAGSILQIWNGFYYPIDLAVTASGNIYVTEPYNYSVKKIDNFGNITSINYPNYNYPQGIVASPSGSVFVANTYNNEILEILPNDIVSVYSPLEYNPYGVALDTNGSLYVSEQYNYEVRKLVETSFYSITPSLPTGLNFNTETGIISGTPTQLTSATTYVISSHNDCGVNNAAITFAIVNDCALPVITTQPLSQTTCNNSNVLFSVVATGGLTYQWNKAGIPIVGQTSSSLILSNVQISDAAIYTVTITGNCGIVTSQEVSLTVNNSSTTSETIMACDSYTWSENGSTYATSGVYTNTTTNAAGCPNVATLNLTIQNSTTYYLDADNDGFGNPEITVQTCTGSPMGYVTVAGDCNDNVASINPGAVDVCYDGIDNDCNGIIDNVGLPGGCTPIVSTMPAAQCGTTVSGLSTSMYATNISGAQGYRFKVTNMSTMAVQTIDRPVNNLAFSAIPGVTYNTQYQVEIGVKYNNVWQPFYGSPCFINTPNPVSTPGAQCGTTLTSMSQWVYTTYVPNVTAYRFRVINLVTNQEQIFTTSTYKFNFTQLASRAYNTTYSVEVSLRNTNGEFLPYNSSCNVTTPSFPETSVRDSQCDYTALSNTEMIAAVVVPTATVYRFYIYNTALEYSATVDRSLNTFNLNMFTGLTPGATYSVQVSVKIGEEFGPYGKVCSLTTPGLAKEQTITKNIVDFKAVAYPNPFAENFKLDVNTSSEEVIKVSVYDMIGKQLEQRQINVSDVESFEIGNNYPSGVYNVIVTQGENTQTLRVIKR